jgi:hypothetical protein
MTTWAWIVGALLFVFLYRLARQVEYLQERVTATETDLEKLRETLGVGEE